MAAKKVAALVCLVLTLVIIADMLMPEKALAAGGGTDDLSVSKGGEKAEAVLHVEKPSWQKMAFGIGMLIAGILSLKYL
jgi:hypothetical protein